MKPLLPLLCLLAIAACSDDPATGAPGRDEDAAAPVTQPDVPAPDASHTETAVVFRCTDGVEFSVTPGAQRVWLNIADDERELRQQPAGSGERYTGDGVELILRDDQAVLVDDEHTRDCTRLDRERLTLPGSGRENGAG